MWIGLVACSTSRIVPYEEVIEEKREALSAKDGLPVKGYVSAKDVRHDLPSKARLSADGSITFRVPPGEKSVTPKSVRCRKGEVKALILARESPGVMGEIALGLLMGVGYAAGAVVLGFGAIFLAL